ncbi:MAG: hypothetical protein MI757_22610 [Pirellulales bacterium]|nr:hypothetical protein [Pirellulales bacterium]
MTRSILCSLAVCAGFAMTSSSLMAQEEIPLQLVPQRAEPLQRGKITEGCCGDEGCCDECGGRRGRRGQGSRGSAAVNRAANFNCGCNGSYKFPVPPLSTYHWPGMYSIQLMTDYHSPWRFPPLRPYTDEPPYNGDGRQVSHTDRETKRITHRGVEPLSAKLNRLYGNR